MNKRTQSDTTDNELTLQQQKFHAAKKSTLISVIVNMLLSLWQIIIGFISHSQGLIADGIHTLSDLVADFVVLIANKKSHKQPDDDHPYGHFRYENGASLILGVILLIVGVGMIWSATQKMLNPELIQEVHTIALVAALVSLIAKESLFRYMLRVANQVNSSMLVANAWHARSDAASSLVVAIGIIGSLCGFKIFDPIAALIVGTFVFRMGYKFTYQSMQDLMDKGADEETLQEIRTVLDGIDEIKGFHDLKTRKSGDFYLVDVHLEVDGNLSIIAGHEIAVNVRDKLMENPQILNVMTHLDPYDKECIH
ncbi:cation diffusion facilitator family transporter [Providencia stuartii]|uniref:cation diffusion facilitator family transporter n=1 Tax=Providencia TaxID=586 RepID=UPI0023E23EA3|nr:cation diffusion facilitator family transporter [Providencia stuartii]ELR5141035.1 cation transporter [Providencia stuartii]WER23544.1 cation diffusion facilitator family transporter [Providencia stuartii]WER27665.1 cation diffusion facilitator family transporter [Providencia stuartii]WER31755.1 cation diffusion facilitator family transporter [Providencia stuartii]